MESQENSADETIALVDRAWLRMDSPENRMIINGIMVFGDPMEYSAVKELFASRLLGLQRFRQYPAAVGLKSYVWRDAGKIDVSRHVTIAELPEASDEDLALEKLVSTLIMEPLDMSRPLWRAYLVPKFKSGSVIIMRVHHSYADGIGLMGVLDCISDEPILDSFPGYSASVSRENKPAGGTLDKVSSGITSVFKGVGFLGCWLVCALKMLVMPSDSKTGYKKRLTIDKKIAWAPSIELKEVKRIAQALGCTMNDVLLGCTAGALRTHLEQTGDLVDGITMRATVPFNLRPLSEALNLGNRFGLVYLDLPVDESDPVERIVRVKKNMDKLKGGMQAIVSFTLLSIVGFLPTRLQRYVLDFFSHKASAVMTNVPGPSRPICFGGVNVTKPLFWVPQSGTIGVGISILSYVNSVQFGLITDATIIQDPDAVIDDFMKEFESLRKLVDNTAEPGGQE